MIFSGRCNKDADSSFDDFMCDEIKELEKLETNEERLDWIERFGKEYRDKWNEEHKED